MRNIATANDFPRNRFSSVRTLDQKVDRLALVDRKQEFLRYRIRSIILFEDLKHPFAGGVSQDDGTWLQMGSGVSETNTVDSRLQVQRDRLPYNCEVLIVDCQCRFRAYALVHGKAEKRRNKESPSSSHRHPPL